MKGPVMMMPGQDPVHGRQFSLDLKRGPGDGRILAPATLDGDDSALLCESPSGCADAGGSPCPSKGGSMSLKGGKAAAAASDKPEGSASAGGCARAVEGWGARAILAGERRSSVVSFLLPSLKAILYKGRLHGILAWASYVRL